MKHTPLQIQKEEEKIVENEMQVTDSTDKKAAVVPIEFPTLKAAHASENNLLNNISSITDNTTMTTCTFLKIEKLKI